MSSPVKYPIRINGRVFSPSEQTEGNAAWATALAFGHGKEVTVCECERGARVPLSVKHYRASASRSHYGLARWPGTGLDHALNCIYFSDETEDSKAGASNPAFHEIEGGMLRVHLARPLGLPGAAKVKDQAKPAENTDARSSRQRASDISLLYKLWRYANLNMYKGRPVDWFKGSLRLLHTAKTFVIDRAGNDLSQRLLIGAVASNKTGCGHNEQVMARNSKDKGRLFVIGRLKAPTAAQRERGKFLLPLMEFHGLPKILITTAMYDGFVGPRDHFKNLLRDGHGYVVVICCIEPSGDEWWKCIDIAGTAVSPDLIPLESSYEGQMERHLVAAGRTFVKPMHADDTAEGEDQRPDFILLDTRPRILIEVWGMQTEQYLSQKAQRLTRYTEKGYTVLSWSADRGEPLPQLPAAAMLPA